MFCCTLLVVAQKHRRSCLMDKIGGREGGLLIEQKSGGKNLLIRSSLLLLLSLTFVSFPIERQLDLLIHFKFFFSLPGSYVIFLCFLVVISLSFFLLKIECILFFLSNNIKNLFICKFKEVDLWLDLPSGIDFCFCISMLKYLTYLYRGSQNIFLDPLLKVLLQKLLIAQQHQMMYC